MKNTGYPRIVFDSWNGMFFAVGKEGSSGRQISGETAIKWIKTGRYTFQEQGRRGGVGSQGSVLTGREAIKEVQEYVKYC
jgi:hypothetical protein